MKEIITYSGIIEKPYQEVVHYMSTMPTGSITANHLPLLLSGASGNEGCLHVKGGPQLYTVFTGEEASAIRVAYVDVDAVNGHFTIFGGWWYRNDYELKPHAKGCQVRYSIANAATPVSSWLVPFLKDYRSLKNEKRTGRVMRAFDDWIAVVAVRLQCKTYRVN
ncbi:hypothetical protein AB4Z29_08775 [Paenibacillus sp. 2TAB23]|uniref:hypothetical protein n=1 Tax=Paenibacillus sp. 2TAB23 TaxID=3233004 RepID=UPI003F9E7823